MTIIMLIKNLEKEKLITIKFEYSELMDFLEFLYFKGLKYKIISITKEN